MWVTQIWDKVFVGYGPYVECDHCHNNGWLEVWQQYFDQKLMTIIPVQPKIYFDFVVWCKICHWGSTIKKKDREKVFSMLEAGKTATKKFFDGLDSKGREHILKNFNRNDFKRVAQFLSFGE
jgi:hypothetical protein